ncbi:MAG: OH-DDVA meta-cleavage compound hydrolase [Gammaproteobacteria bacterium]|jgi:OH-DDVA meta-cleavage compound hydrolase
MIIDCHAHISSPPELKAYHEWLIITGGREGKCDPEISDTAIRMAMNNNSSGRISHLDGIKNAGISTQLLSPRPNQMMHNQKPSEIVKWYTQVSNDLVYRYTQLWPEKFLGIASLPQMSGEPVDEAVSELRRCVNELGFRGCILNPDPYENSGPEPPPLWDEYWYPIYNTLCELDLPCHIHGTGSPSSREYYNHYYIHEESIAVLAFLCSDIFENFPTLKVVASHGGGSIPFQIGRYIASERSHKQRDFRERLNLMFFDTVLHDPASVELLIKVVGAKNCLFGTEWPGLGSVIDPDSGRVMDNLAPDIQKFSWLSDDEIEAILWKNTTDVYKLDDILSIT